MHASTLVFGLLLASVARAAIKHEPIRPGLELAPGQAETIMIAAAAPLEIGWEAVQKRKCTMDCVRAIDLSGGQDFSVAAKLGASQKYTPSEGKIIVKYANKGDFPVTLNVFKIVRVCDAQACAFLHGDPKTRELVFKVDQFKSISTSADSSYSTISGVTTSGKPFTLKAVWWTDENRLLLGCPKLIAGYLDRSTPKEEYSPTIISGQALPGDDLVLRSVDTCATNAPRFGVPEENVYR